MLIQRGISSTCLDIQHQRHLMKTLNIYSNINDASWGDTLSSFTLNILFFFYFTLDMSRSIRITKQIIVTLFYSTKINKCYFIPHFPIVSKKTLLTTRLSFQHNTWRMWRWSRSWHTVEVKYSCLLVKEDTPTTVRVSRAQTLWTASVLLTVFHRKSAHLKYTHTFYLLFPTHS